MMRWSCWGVGSCGLWLVVTRSRRPCSRFSRPGPSVPSTLISSLVPVVSADPASVAASLPTVVLIPVVVFPPARAPTLFSSLFTPACPCRPVRPSVPHRQSGAGHEVARYLQVPTFVYRDDAACRMAVPSFVFCLFVDVSDTRALLFRPFHLSSRYFPRLRSSSRSRPRSRPRPRPRPRPRSRLRYCSRFHPRPRPRSHLVIIVGPLLPFPFPFPLPPRLRFRPRFHLMFFHSPPCASVGIH